MTEPIRAWTEDVVIHAAGRGDHVAWTQIVEVLQRVWMRFLTVGIGRTEDEMFFGSAPRPITRELNVRFEGSVHDGDLLTCSVRVLDRSTRAFTLEAAVTGPSGTSVATGRVVIVMIDPQTARPVEIPGDLWLALSSGGGPVE